MRQFSSRVGKSAVAVAQDYSQPVGVFTGYIESRVFQRLESGGHGQLGETGHTASVSLRDVLAGVEIGYLA